MEPKTEKRKFPIRPEDYELLEVVGQGVSALVYRARCIPLEEDVAIKILDFERNNSDLNNICREAQIMILIDHPNVLNAHCSFVNDHTLWVVMPYMAGGSCLHIMKAAYPDGFEEVVIATVLKEVLKGLEYLHNHGHIHRDVKAGNILVDSRGGIKLGDFGVSACLFDSGDRQRTRNTFVGTPCWMAPEVMEQLHGYDFKADIWSFGITALELAHGNAPFSKYPPMKVLLMTLQNAPPCLDHEKDRKFSRSFKEMVAACLVKNPSKRPSAQKLLKQTFFKQARSQDYLIRKILDGLPSLGDRHQALKDKEEFMLAQKKMPDGKKEELSQSEYKRGISGWNFDIEDLKAQASSISDNEDSAGSSLFEIDSPRDRMPTSFPLQTNFSFKDDDEKEATSPQKSTFSSPDQAMYQRAKLEGSDNESKNAGRTDQKALQNGSHFNHSESGYGFNETMELNLDEKRFENVSTHHDRKASASSSSSEVLPSSRVDSFKSNYMGNGIEVAYHTAVDANAEAIPRAHRPAASGTEDLDDKTKPPVVQQRGRFKVTSETIDALPPICLQKSHSLQVLPQLPSPTTMLSPADATSNLGCSLFPHLHAILQANIVQRDNILSLMRQISTGDPSPISTASINRSVDGTSFSVATIITEKSMLEAAYEKEKEHVQEIAELQWRLVCMQDEVQKARSRSLQM